MTITLYKAYKILEASHRVLQTAVQMGDAPSLTRRRFVLATALMLGLAGCQKEPSPKGANSDIQSDKTPPNIITIPATIPGLLDAIKNSSSQAVIEESINILAETDEGPFYLRKLIQEGTFMHFYYASMRLWLMPTGDTTVQNIIAESKESWEKALALNILGARVASGRISPSDGIRITRPFLSAQDHLLQFGAIIGLLRIGAQEELKAFARQHPQTRIAMQINYFLDNPDPALLDWNSLNTYTNAFFRYPKLLKLLIDDAQVSSRPEHIVWEVGCASGLMTESIRIALKANGINARVIGTDISPLALFYAARGRYLLDSFALTSFFLAKQRFPEKVLLEFFAQQYGLSSSSLFSQFYEKKEGLLGPLYIAQRKGGDISFDFDDITSPNSPIPDNSVDAIVYTNVHSYLSAEGKQKAIEKIFRKLKVGGKLYLIDVDFCMLDFENVFGKSAISFLNESTIVFTKTKDKPRPPSDKRKGIRMEI